MLFQNKTKENIKLRVIEKQAEGTTLFGWVNVKPGNSVKIDSEINKKNAIKHNLVEISESDIISETKENKKETKKETVNVSNLDDKNKKKVSDLAEDLIDDGKRNHSNKKK